jgi:hypothetical protein
VSPAGHIEGKWSQYEKWKQIDNNEEERLDDMLHDK